MKSSLAPMPSSILDPGSFLSVLKLKLIQAAAVTLSNALGKNEDYSGGVIAVSYLNTISARLSQAYSTTVGNPGLKVDVFSFHVKEKIYRLRRRRQEGHDDVASSQSADSSNPDPEKRTYGGAVYFTRLRQEEIIIALSGYPAKVDEAIAFVLGGRLNLNSPIGYENPLLELAEELLAGVYTGEQHDFIA